MKVFAITNCKIYKRFQPVKVANGLVVLDDKILYVGDSKKAMKIAKDLGGEVVDLSGYVVLPGFIDTHLHLDSFGITLNSLDLRGVRSIKELKLRLRKFYDEHKDIEWIIGRGWDQELFIEHRLPTRWDIDEVISDRPVLLTRVCGHIAVLNSKALDTLLKILKITPDNPLLDRDEEGRLTGIVKEDILWNFRNSIEYRPKDFLKSLSDGINELLKFGVTTIGFVSCSPKTLLMMQMLRVTRGELPIRIRTYLDVDTLISLRSLGISRGFGDNYLKIMGVKIIADGSLGARTAWLSKPYSDDPRTSGIALVTKERLLRIVKDVNEQNLQLAIHAIGDRTIDMVLDVLSELGDVSTYRHRIEHASVTRPEQIKRIANLGLVVTIQPHFIITDYWVVNRVGVDRAPWVYAYRSLIREGVMVGISTDCPVEPVNPWETIYAAITRGEHEGIELAKYTENEKLSITETLHYYTIGSAYTLFEESNLGSLEVGKYADFIVIDKDPLQLEPKEVRNIKNLMTVVGGKVVYRFKNL